MQITSWNCKKVLVTGAGGFIGSHLVEELVRRGAKVRAMVRYSSTGSYGWLMNSDVRSSMELIQADLRDADAVLRAVKDQEVVFHLGALISIPYSYVSPSETVAVNVAGTQNVLSACRFFGVTRVMQTSTSEVYGTAEYVPINEKHPLQGQSPYSASKIGADHLAESYYRSFDLPVTIVRPFNTFGPRQSARAIIPTIIVQLLTGADIHLGSLTPTRDFTYVSDTVAGMIRAIECETTLGKTVNLGTNVEVSVGELVRQISSLLGREACINQAAERIRPALSEVNRLLSDNSLMKDLTSWQPTVRFNDGLRLTIDWFKMNISHYQRAQSEYVV